MRPLSPTALLLATLALSVAKLPAETIIRILDTPDYRWHAACFGTACGNLMGFWDRNGFPNIYTGPTGDGLAPLDDYGTNNINIRALWASQKGLDGRPSNKPGHYDDYYVDYESTAADPYTATGIEHEPDCIGDFIGANQKKWINMNGECDGNIDGYSFVYWDTNGFRRNNYSPTTNSGPPIDIQSGLRSFSRYRGYEADVFTQLTEFNTTIPAGRGFTFNDLKHEIDQGYPVLVMLQGYGVTSRDFSDHVPGMPRANPSIHGMLIFGYYIFDYPMAGTTQWIYFRDSWGQGDRLAPWNSTDWMPLANMPARGIIGYRPRPQITRIARSGTKMTVEWHGPATRILDDVSGSTSQPHYYTLERSTTLNPPNFVPVAPATQNHSLSFPDLGGTAFLRLRLTYQ